MLYPVVGWVLRGTTGLVSCDHELNAHACAETARVNERHLAAILAVDIADQRADTEPRVLQGRRVLAVPHCSCIKTTEGPALQPQRLVLQDGVWTWPCLWGWFFCLVSASDVRQVYGFLLQLSPSQRRRMFKTSLRTQAHVGLISTWAELDHIFTLQHVSIALSLNRCMSIYVCTCVCMGGGWPSEIGSICPFLHFWPVLRSFFVDLVKLTSGNLGQFQIKC